ncbi:MAG: gamma-glutamyl-gamma-aminobutyrate hydrolase family protein, partial [Firmicutes bacterium]|nr:gamma-glutamyl-gamma-aminobutyrate hydrolase family protein [Bacillota bacterium]
FYVREPYVRCIEAAGGVPLLVPPLEEEGDLHDLLGSVDGVLLPGGVDLDPIHFGEEPVEKLGVVEPHWDRLELAVARFALASDLPVLGICRGVQVLNVAAGGSLYQDLISQTKGQCLQHSQKAPRWYATHSIKIEPKSFLEEMLGAQTARVNSHHHQAVKTPAPGFRVTATSPDGIIECIESEHHRFACGVQWHPELMVGHYPEQMEIFRRFVRCAQKAR